MSNLYTHFLGPFSVDDIKCSEGKSHNAYMLTRRFAYPHFSTYYFTMSSRNIP